MISSLRLSSLVHFEFIFVCAVRKCSDFILLHATVWFSKHHLLKRVYVFAFVFMPPLL